MRSVLIVFFIFGLSFQVLALESRTPKKGILKLGAKEWVRVGPDKVHLVELYSSEGCSSCPPADDWFASLTTEKDLFKKFVPVAFQVDYWDQLGWVDPHSSAENTKRQQAHARTWPAPRMYTPAVIIDGEEFVNWQTSRLTYKPEKTGLLRLLRRDSDWLVEYEPASRLSAQLGENLVIQVADLAMNLESKPNKGENEGRTLRHQFLVEKKITYPVIKSQKISQQIPDREIKKGKGLAIWIENLQTQKSLQALGVLY